MPPHQHLSFAHIMWRPRGQGPFLSSRTTSLPHTALLEVSTGQREELGLDGGGWPEEFSLPCVQDKGPHSTSELDSLALSHAAACNPTRSENLAALQREHCSAEGAHSRIPLCVSCSQNLSTTT